MLPTMNLFIFSLLLITVSAGPKEKKTTLEDIESDYTSSERQTKLTPPPPPSPPKVAAPAQSPTQFGFVPRKTIADYARKVPAPAYVQPQYISQYVQPQQPEVNDYSQYATTQQYTTSIPQKYNTGPQYSAPQYTSPQQKYAPQGQQAYTYVVQAPNPNQLQNYENVQYITDNSIGGQVSPQYYTNTPQQYVYLQQYTSPSTAVQTVVEPKGALQYIMYVPAYAPPTVADQTQNYETVVYAGDEAQDLTSTYQVSQPSQAPQYTTQYIQPNAQVQYTQPKSQYSKAEYVIRREPKSLLDSYIPSILQLQYYKQLQQNSVQEPVKVSQTVSGKEYIKNSYRPEGPSGDETVLTYRYQPSSYKS